MVNASLKNAEIEFSDSNVFIDVNLSDADLVAQKLAVAMARMLTLRMQILMTPLFLRVK